MLYFFNVAGAAYDPDVEGYELASMGDARLMAARHAGELLRDRPGVVWQGEELRVEVTDANQLVLFTVIVIGVDAPAGNGKT
jgi:phage terminase large subunit-like protein